MVLSIVLQYGQLQQPKIKGNLVVGQTAITCCNKVKKIGKHVIGADMFV
jgi:hypothetical protein